MERATGIEPVLPTWKGEYSALYFQHLQNRPARINVHATHTVHAVPELRIAAGRLRDGFSRKFHFLGTRFVRSLRANSDGLPALARNCEISEAESCQPGHSADIMSNGVSLRCETSVSI